VPVRARTAFGLLRVIGGLSVIDELFDKHRTS
jgi:hypothetical protein